MNEEGTCSVDSLLNTGNLVDPAEASQCDSCQ
jgi:hypothetical protein